MHVSLKIYKSIQRYVAMAQVYGAEGLALSSLDLVRSLCYTGKPIVAICYCSYLLVSISFRIKRQYTESF